MEQDGTLSYRMSCGHGVCGSDGMKINGSCRLACQALVRDYQCPEVVLEPLPGFRCSRTCWSIWRNSWMGSGSSVPICSPPRILRRRKEDRPPRKGKDWMKSSAAFHAPAARLPARVSWVHSQYVGPAALVWAFRYIFDSRDEAKTGQIEANRSPCRGLGLHQPL